MSIQVTITTAPIQCSTTDGRVLQLESMIEAQMSLSVALEAPPDEEACSVIAASFEFADNEGTCWRIISRFPSDVLIRSMMDFSNIGRIVPWDDLPEKVKQEFERHVVLRGIEFRSDDRFIRPLIVGRSVREVQFKYFGVTFELAVILRPVGEALNLEDVWARTTSPILDYEVEELPPLFFPVDWRYFLVNTFCLEHGNSDIPIPFVAEPTNKKSEPQPNVIIRSAT